MRRKRSINKEEFVFIKQLTDLGLKEAKIQLLLREAGYRVRSSSAISKIRNVKDWDGYQEYLESERERVRMAKQKQVAKQLKQPVSVDGVNLIKDSNIANQLVQRLTHQNRLLESLLAQLMQLNNNLTTMQKQSESKLRFWQKKEVA